MCKTSSPLVASKGIANATSTSSSADMRKRRSKRDKQNTVVAASSERRIRTDCLQSKKTKIPPRRIKRKSHSLRKHENDKASGGVEALLPSVGGLAVLGCIIMARMGFRGRASVAGIDLGTTNSVICVQALSKSVGEIECIPDPSSGSPIVPSVISFLDHHDRPRSSHGSKKEATKLHPDPSIVVVGNEAKLRIDTHPHHTLYHAKRVLGRPHTDDAIRELSDEVEFDVIPTQQNDESPGSGGVNFRVPFHSAEGDGTNFLSLKPQRVGSYIVNHLMQMTHKHLGHDNVKSAVIAIPAKFDGAQRQATVEAFRDAGVAVARILEEPTAAALAYGLHKKNGVDYIMVYDFGGGTLDVSILHVSDGGYVDVMGSDGDDRLGGADFDAAVAHFLLSRDGGEEVVKRVSGAMKHLEDQMTAAGGTPAGEDVEEILSTSCPALEAYPLCTISSFHTIGEKMKIELSSYPSGGGTVHQKCLALPEDKSFPTSITEFCSALRPLELVMTSSEYDNAVSELYRRSMLPIRRIVADLNLQKDEIDEVVMVGGSTRMPQIRVMVRDELGISSLNTHIDPDLTVAYGAASVID